MLIYFKSKGFVVKASIFFFLIFSAFQLMAQRFNITETGDTLNFINAKGVKSGKWVIEVPELRGESGHTDEGVFVDGEKHGIWRMYNPTGDLIGLENYFHGGKSGSQKYFSYLGGLEREEFWRAYNPNAPYDTIPIYGTGNGEIVEFKIVKSQPYSVKDGVWKYYDPATGRIIRKETWDRNVLIIPDKPVPSSPTTDKPAKIEKTSEMLDWERKNKGKKGAIIDGRTSY